MCKCSTCRFLCVSDGCFSSEQEDGVTAKGCLACNSGALTCCTKDKDFADSSESSAYDVIIPPVENLCLRSACFLGYCGFSCKSEDRPLGCTRECTSMCCQQQCGTQVLTGKVLKRSCVSCVTLQSILSCEAEGAGAGEFIVLENSLKGLMCCCFECGNAAKASCCPTPITCCGHQGQCCCCYYRGNFPCDKFAPCEVGCCSVMCVDKKDIIMEAESGDRERTSTGAIEATVVEKGGAPALAEEMER